MDSPNQLWKDVTPIVLGQLIGVAAVASVFAVLGRFYPTVLFGSLAGAVLATANYFFMYYFATKAADIARKQDVAGGQKVIRLSYMGRMIGLLVALIVLAKSGWCNVIALAVPLALNRPILTVYARICRKGGATE